MSDFDLLSDNEQINALEAEQKALFAHSQGYKTLALGNASHAEGQETQSLDNASHAEGRETIAGGKCSHAQGFKTKAIADYSVAMGCDIQVSGKHSVGIQLKKEDDMILSQPNTFAVVGGNVGINTLSPQSALEVNGNAKISNLNIESNEYYRIIRTQQGKDIVIEINKNSEGDGKLHYIKNGDDYMQVPSKYSEVINYYDLEIYSLPTSLSNIEISSGTYTLPLRINDDGKLIDVFNILLKGNVTIQPYSGSGFDGQKITLRIAQDSTGSRLLTLGGNFNVPSSITLTLSTDPNALDIITAMYDLNRNKWDVIDFKKGY